MRGCIKYSRIRTLSKLFEKLSEPFLPLSIISSPTIKPSVFLPLSPKIGPAYSCAFHLSREQFLKFFLGVFLLFLDTQCPKFACTFSTVLVEGFATRRNRRKEHIAWVRYEERKRRIPRMQRIYVFLPE